MFRERLDEIHAKVEGEKSWWEQRRAGIQADFMKELDSEASSAKQVTDVKTGGEDDASVLVDASSGSKNPKKKPGKK